MDSEPNVGKKKTTPPGKKKGPEIGVKKIKKKPSKKKQPNSSEAKDSDEDVERIGPAVIDIGTELL